jgi:hypothetical protein
VMPTALQYNPRRGFGSDDGTGCILWGPDSSVIGS